MKVAVAGASGFVGRELLKELSPDFEIRAITRGHRESQGSIEWVSTDLFSYQSTLDALAGCDVAIYLVHSMIPTSRLFQGSFQDTDLQLADNFAKACLKNNVKQIVYLGGLEPTGKSSKHLKSRLEVEEVFKATGIATTVLRAGMVVGEGGSSFEILKNLVFNLPVMVLPKWTQSTTQAIYLSDLIKVIKNCVGDQSMFGKTINVVNGEKITYRDFIHQTADYLGKSKLLIPVPINYTSFSKLWVKIFGQSDYELVSPLIDSLVCDLDYPDVPSEIKEVIEYKTYRQMLGEISKSKTVKTASAKKTNKNTVRSIQRLTSRSGLDASEVSKLYAAWLPQHFKKLINVKWDQNFLNFFILGLSRPLLVLQEQKDPNELNRAKFHIVGGLLSKENGSGWLEFRKVIGPGYTLTSINDFEPALPWYLYKYTQAILHKKVMESFGQYLDSQIK